MTRSRRALGCVLPAGRPVGASPGSTATASAGGNVPSLGIRSAASLPSHARGSPPPWSGKAFRQGAVAVADPYAAEAGAQILESGGDAVNTAVAPSPPATRSAPPAHAWPGPSRTGRGQPDPAPARRPCASASAGASLGYRSAEQAGPAPRATTRTTRRGRLGTRAHAHRAAPATATGRCSPHRRSPATAPRVLEDLLTVERGERYGQPVRMCGRPGPRDTTGGAEGSAGLSGTRNGRRARRSRLPAPAG